MFTKYSMILVFILLCAFYGSAESPHGADTVDALYAPVLAGSGAFVTSAGSSQGISLNPAAEGGAQRTILDAGYLALAGLGDEEGLGHALSLGILHPTRYAVFSGSLRLLSSPFDALPIGTSIITDLNVAKELYPGMSLGAGINLGVGEDWTASLDLGFRHTLGSMGGLTDFTWAAVLGGLGKNYLPTAFTPQVGIAFDFLTIPGKENKTSPLRLGASADLGFPGFTNMTGKLGLRATVAELITISSSTGFNLQEAMDGRAPSAIPSVALTLNFTLQGDKNKKEGKLPSDGEVSGSIAARPLYDGIWAFGSGATWTIGVADKKAPEILVEYPKTRWISPNNDGRVDVLEFPISITDQRYVSRWVLEFQDESGTVVRSFFNKERRPETQGVRNILDRLMDVKSGVEVPDTLRWDGIMESGELAPDGLYYFTLSASDDNGNTASSPQYSVAVDNTPPSVLITEPQEGQRIFSPDGDTNKDTFTIDLSLSHEDLWEASIHDSMGTKIRTFDIQDGATSTIVWNGKDDQGAIVPDGIYSFQISAVDRAQNAASASLGNIIVNTIQPTVSLLIGDGYFSPNGDDIQDRILLSPGVPIKEGLVDWVLTVQDKTSMVHRTLKGSSAAPGRMEFDGRNDTGSVLSEGVYQAKLRVSYRNGYTAEALSPSFILDLSPPSGAVQAVYTAFSPNNDGKLDEIEILQEGTEEQAWTGELRRILQSSAGAGVLTRTFRFPGIPEPRISWDGRDDGGRLATDGEYEYRLKSTDRAGNTGYSNAVRFTLSTADTPVLLSTDKRAFSPNGDGIMDTITLIPQVQLKEGIRSWKIEVLDVNQQAIRLFEGQGTLPGNIVWDGRNNDRTMLSDGIFGARIVLVYAMGNQPTAQAQSFILDTRAPEATISAPFTLFSPNGDGRRDFIPIEVLSEGNDEWKAQILDSSDKVVKNWEWRGKAPSLAWNGTDNAGNLVPDSTYRLLVNSTDGAGNSTRRVLEGIIVNSQIPRAFLTASTLAISPNGDGIAEDVRFSILLNPQEGIETWKMVILDEKGKEIRSFNRAGSVLWDGKDTGGIVREGRFTASLTVNYTKGDEIAAAVGPILVDISPPALSFISTPQYFSPDNDGMEDELSIKLSTQDEAPIASWIMEIREPLGTRQVFYKLEGSGTPSELIRWDGRSNKGELVQAATDYPVSFQAVDALGNASKIESIIGVDVLIIREGDILKIKVPSIIFRENAPDFQGLPQETVDNNLRVLKRIAEILNKFRDYRVKVEGHANPVTRTATEEAQELQPLSEARAKAVQDKLVEFGVDRNRLSYIGMGGTRPVVRWEDRNDWWKNRRVEFILIK